MGRGLPGATELDFAVNVAGNFVKLAVAKGSRIGLTTYDDSGCDHEPRNGFLTLARVKRRALAQRDRAERPLTASAPEAGRFGAAT